MSMALFRPGAAWVLIAAISVAACRAASGEQGQSNEPSEAELVTVENDRDVFPPAFRGKWAADQATCADPDGKGAVDITANRMSGYESDAVLLKNQMSYEAAADGKQASTLLALVAESGEGELGIQNLQISLSGGQLFVSREPIQPDEKWALPLIRCPIRPDSGRA